MSSDAHDGVQIGLAVLGAGDVPLAQSQAQGTVGHALHVDLKSPDGKDHYAFVVTPLNGCPARDANRTARN